MASASAFNSPTSSASKTSGRNSQPSVWNCSVCLVVSFMCVPPWMIWASGRFVHGFQPLFDRPASAKGVRTCRALGLVRVCGENAPGYQCVLLPHSQGVTGGRQNARHRSAHVRPLWTDRALNDRVAREFVERLMESDIEPDQLWQRSIFRDAVALTC